MKRVTPNFYEMTPQKYWPMPSDILADSGRGIWKIQPERGSYIKGGWLVTERRGHLAEPMASIAPIENAPSPELAIEWALGLAQRIAVSDRLFEKYIDDVCDWRDYRDRRWPEWMLLQTFIDLPSVGKFILDSDTVVCTFEQGIPALNLNLPGIHQALCDIQLAIPKALPVAKRKGGAK